LLFLLWAFRRIFFSWNSIMRGLCFICLSLNINYNYIFTLWFSPFLRIYVKWTAANNWHLKYAENAQSANKLTAPQLYLFYFHIWYFIRRVSETTRHNIKSRLITRNAQKNFIHNFRLKHNWISAVFNRKLWIKFFCAFRVIRRLFDVVPCRFADAANKISYMEIK